MDDILLGDIVHLKVLHRHIIIISSVDAISGLLERRSAMSASRFDSVMLNEM